MITPGWCYPCRAWYFYSMDKWLRQLSERQNEDGGFAGQPGGASRPDSTAWAVVVLAASGVGAPALASARSSLVQAQLPDGRVPLSPQHPATAWPTPLAVLAWQGDPNFTGPRQRALDFLTTYTGHHWKAEANSVVAHDPALLGWPWVEGTHSWIEPTSLGLMALTAGGLGGHERAKQAEMMIMDRQLPAGGWNYGNTKVYGTELRPMPESTGVALSALAGRVKEAEVAPSLAYMAERLKTLRSPQSLGWGAMGLGAWGHRPEQIGTWIDNSLSRQDVFGPYDTINLVLLLAGRMARRGLLSLLDQG